MFRHGKQAVGSRHPAHTQASAGGTWGGWIAGALWPVHRLGRHIDQVLDGLHSRSSCGTPVVAHGIVVGADDHVDAFGGEANPRTLQDQRYEVLRHLFSNSEVNCGSSVPFFDLEIERHQVLPLLNP